MTRADDYIVVTGAIHMHTTDSDGAKSHEEVEAIGREVGLDFLMFSDHMTLKGYREGKEGYYGDILVLIGYEHNDQDDCNHYLIFGLEDVLPASMTAAEYVVVAADKRAFGILAHPDEIRGRDARYRSYPWTDWSVTSFDGLEIWNQMSEWMENLKAYNQIRMILSPRKFLRGPTSRILHIWDELSQTRKVVGIASSDAHGFLYRAGPVRLTIFPYKVQLKTLRTHLLLAEPLSPDFATAKHQIYNALRECRAFVSNYRWGDVAGFRFEIQSDLGIATLGGAVPLGTSAEAGVSVPRHSRIVLIADGKPVAEGRGKELTCRITHPGAYRVEVYRGRKGWIFSNHIRVISN